MENNNRNKLIQELKNSSFLPPFNEELYKGCTQDHQKAIREIQEIYKLRNDEELSEKIKPIIQIKIKDVERTKRVQLAYLMFRINKIQAQYWQDSGELSDTHIENLSNSEKEYFKGFDQLIRKLVRIFPRLLMFLLKFEQKKKQVAQQQEMVKSQIFQKVISYQYDHLMLSNFYRMVQQQNCEIFIFIMKVIVCLDSQKHELLLEEPTIERLTQIITEQFNITYQFELLTTDNQQLTELKEDDEITVQKIQQTTSSLQKLKSFFSEAGPKIKQKTLTHKSTFVDSLFKKPDTLEQQYEQPEVVEQPQVVEQSQAELQSEIKIVNQSKVSEHNEQEVVKIIEKELTVGENSDSHIVQKCELSGIQQQDSATLLDEKQSDRLLLNELQEQQQEQQVKHNSQQQKKRPKLAQIKQQSQTQKDEAFAFAEEMASIPRPNKRQLILQRMEEEKAERERAAKQQQEANRIIKQIQEKIKQKEQMIKQKDEALIMPELEKRKAILAQKRELSQPIRLNDITEHQKKYEEEKKIKEFEREHHKQEVEIEIKQKAPRFPKSQAQLRVEEEDKQQKGVRQQEMEKKKLARLRQLKYADVAQEMYFKEHPAKPKQVSPPKEDQSKQIKEIQITEQNIRKIRKIIAPQKHLSQESKESPHENQDRSFHQENRPPRPIAKKVPKATARAPEKPAAELPPKPKTTDYLQQLRQQRKSQVPVEEQWEKIIENKQIENEQKFQNVLNNVQKLEQKAKEREKLALYNRDIQAEEEANNFYIASIKAKLAILEKN